MSKSSKDKGGKATPKNVAKDAPKEAPEIQYTAPDTSDIPEAPAGEPTWDIQTWKDVARQRLGVESFVVASAMKDMDPGARYTERQMRVIVEKHLNTPIRRNR